MAGNSFDTEPSASASSGLSAALQRLWEKFLPEIAHRVRVVEEAVNAVETGRLTAELSADAHQAAHKLAGTLGTFGHAQGSQDALALEAAFDSPTCVRNPSELRALVMGLQRIVHPDGQ